MCLMLEIGQKQFLHNQVSGIGNSSLIFGEGKDKYKSKNKPIFATLYKLLDLLDF